MKLNKKLNKNLVTYIISVTVLTLFFLFLIVCTQIGFDVKKRCELAQNRYGGKCVDALMRQVADETNANGKNDAIWALGQLGDRKAITFLEKYDNHQDLPAREPWDKGISQYELRKAIRLLRNGVNISAPFWRGYIVQAN